MPKKNRDLANINWEDIRLFLVVAEAGSIRSAAKILEIHHSTVARRINKLETNLNYQIICANSVGLSASILTERGCKLREIAKAMFDAAKNI